MATAKKLPSGSWRVQLYIGKDNSGKNQYKSFTADTKKEAEFLAAQYNNSQIDVCRSEFTVKDATERYIKSKENVLSPSTVRGYFIIWRNIPDELANIKIKDITQEIVQTVFNDYAKLHSPKYCRNVHGLLSAVLKNYRPELILNTTLPQKEKNDIYVPDEQEVLKIYELVKNGILEMPFLLATQCGLRASEIAALTRSNVKDGYIIIKQAAVVGADNNEHFKTPKSFSGYRKVPISSEFESKLLKSSNERIVELTAVRICDNWVKFRKRYNLPESLNFHALRHHFASKCLLMNIPQKYIAEMMGHNSLDMIEKVYQHTFPSAMEMFAKQVRESSNILFIQHEIQHKEN